MMADQAQLFSKLLLDDRRRINIVATTKILKDVVV